MKRLVTILLALLLLGAALTGCGTDKEPDYSALIKPALDFPVESCFSAQQATAVAGVPMSLEAVLDDGTHLSFADANGMINFGITVINQTKDTFQSVIGDILSAQTVSGIGELAVCVYYPDGTVDLMAWQNGYALDVVVTGTEQPTDSAETIAKAILAFIAQKEQPTA